MSLLVVGSMAFDEIETPFGKTGRIVGGAATYIALSASYFAEPVHVVSVIGEDFPQDFVKKLHKRGVKTGGLQVKHGEKSFFWKGKYHNDLNSRDTLVTELNVLGDFKPEVPEECRKSEFLMLGNLSPEVQKSVIHQMKENPKLIAMDTMNFWMDIALQDLKDTIELVDLLIINDEEARQLTSEYSLVKAAKKIIEMGPSYLVIKKGEHGALLFHENQVFFAPALPLEEVFDPTGAGDTFAGGFMGYLARTGNISFANMKRAVIVGSAMASFCVEKFGTEQLEDLKEQQIDDRLKEFVDLVHFDIDLVEG